MSRINLQLGGAYIYQWECAILLALDYFFDIDLPPFNAELFEWIDSFLGQVAEIKLEGEAEIRVEGDDGVSRVEPKELEDITLVNGDRRILIQVKTKQAEGERWTLTESLLLKALYKFYDSYFLAEEPGNTRFVFLTNRPFNPDLVSVKNAIAGGRLDGCAGADKLCKYLDRYARKEKKKKESIDDSRFREMLARTALVEYLRVDDEVKAAVQTKLQALGWHDSEQAHALLLKHFAYQSTRTGGGTVTRESVIEVLEPPPKALGEDEQDRQLAYLPKAFEIRKRQPPFEPELILIPAGEFLMGSTQQQVEQFVAQGAEGGWVQPEVPQHSVGLPAYYLAKTPVTNAQYLAFVESTGHVKPDHWKGGQPPKNKEDHPVVNVNWWNAVSYCQWLANTTGRPYRLPSEAEWEMAARGTGGRIYPWGDEWDAERCNTRERGPGDTTSVGQYSPGGDSPYSCVDMAGNVWEWTLSIRESYPYDPEDGREHPMKSSSRVMRGGSFYNDMWSVRCTFRDRDLPGTRAWNYGFRVCVAAQQE